VLAFRRIVVLLMALPAGAAACMTIADTMSAVPTWDLAVEIAVLVSVVMAAILSVPLSAVGRSNPAVGALSVGLAAVAAGVAFMPWGGTVALLDLEPRVTFFLATSLVVIGATGVLRFLVTFPSTPTPSQLQAWLEEADARDKRHIGGLGWAGLDLTGRRGRQQYAALMRFVTQGRLPRTCAIVVAITAACGYLSTVLGGRPEVALTITAFLVIVAYVLLLTGALGGWANLMPARFALSDESERRKLVWVTVGLQAGMMTMLTLVVVGGVLHLTPLRSVGAIIVGLAQPACFILIMVGISIGAFWEGALDPRLAISRAKVLSLLALATTVLFAAIETVLSTWITAAIGLPDFWASALAGAGLALAVGPMHGWIKERVNAPPPEGEATGFEASN